MYRRLPYGPSLDVFVLDMRTHKDPNDGNTYADPKRGLLGRQQREWLIRELKRSTATWKVIANDLPIGVVVPDAPVPRRVSRRAIPARRPDVSWSSPRCCGPPTGPE
ncbi:alkaline phosphatase D family protein [Micromonospora sp. M12]